MGNIMLMNEMMMLMEALQADEVNPYPKYVLTPIRMNCHPIPGVRG